MDRRWKNKKNNDQITIFGILLDNILEVNMTLNDREEVKTSDLRFLSFVGQQIDTRVYSSRFALKNSFGSLLTTNF